jgi:hypothetical protein
MAGVDELQLLLEELAEAAEQGRGVKLSADMTHLLMSVIEERRGVAPGFVANAATHQFRIVLGDDDGEGPATILGATSDAGVAQAIFAAAAKQNTGRKIRLYDRSVVIEETKY